MKLPFLSKINTTDSSRSSSSSSSSWPWPAYCQQPKTLSFRTSENMFKTLNSAYIDVVDTPAESCFTNSSESASFSTASDDQSGAGDPAIETVIRGLRSERLFFEPGESNSILEEAKTSSGGDNELPFKESVILSMDSQDPCEDFKKSMEEMVEAHGIKDWEGLEELLCCYLKVNAKSNHGYIIGAFIDLLVGFAFVSSTTNDSCCSCSRSPSSPLSFYTSSFSDDSSSTPCVSSLEADQEDIHISPCLSSFEAKPQNEIIKEN